MIIECILYTQNILINPHFGPKVLSEDKNFFWNVIINFNAVKYISPWKFIEKINLEKDSFFFFVFLTSLLFFSNLLSFVFISRITWISWNSQVFINLSTCSSKKIHAQYISIDVQSFALVFKKRVYYILITRSTGNMRFSRYIVNALSS